MSRLLAGRTDKTKVDDELPVLIITKNMPNTEDTKQEEEPWDNSEEPSEEESDICLSELYTRADQVDRNKTSIPDLFAFIKEYSVDSKCDQAVTSVETSRSTITYDTDRGIVHVSPIDGASGRLIAAALHSRILHHCYYSLLAEHPEGHRVYDTMCR